MPPLIAAPPPEQAARQLRFLWLFSLLSLTSGCAATSAPPVRLVIISPHRDEIRQEVALGFQDWFRDRTATRRQAACEQLTAWVEKPEATARRAAAEQALRDLFHDWSADDLGELTQLRQVWQQEPTPDHGRALLAGLQPDRGPWRRPLEIVWQDVGGGTSQIARYVKARFDASPGGIGIDLLFGGGTDIFLRFADQGVLQPLNVAEMTGGRIPAQLNGVTLYDPEGRWFGPVLSSFGILCNREVLRRRGLALPQLWSDLGRPAFHGWVGAGDPRLTGSVHMVYEIILQGDGWENGFRKLLVQGANVHSFIRDSGTLTRAVISGQVAAAGVVDVNGLSAVGHDPQHLTYVLPAVERRQAADGAVIVSGGTIINPDAIAVLKGAPRSELARAFVQFTLSDAGQRLFLLRPGVPGGPRQHPLCRLSVVADLYRQHPPEDRSVGEANPFLHTEVLPYQSKLGTQRWDALNDLIGAVIVDAHEDLAAAGAAISGALATDHYHRLWNELLQLPCTERELMEHARRILEEGPRARVEQVSRWGEEARARYRRIRAEAEQLLARQMRLSRDAGNPDGAAYAHDHSDPHP